MIRNTEKRKILKPILVKSIPFSTFAVPQQFKQN